MAEDQTARPEPCHPAGQRTAPALPLLAVEFCQRLHRFLLQLRLAGSDGLQQRPGDGIAGSCPGGGPTPASRARRAVLPGGGRGVCRLSSCPSRLGSGSMAAMPSAMEQQRRRATRRSCTGSGAKLRLARSHSSRTRCIQKARPDFFWRALSAWAKGWSIRLRNGPSLGDLLLSPLRGCVVSRSYPGLAPRAVILRRFAAGWQDCDGFQISLNGAPLYRNAPNGRPMGGITSVMCIFSRFRITLSRYEKPFKRSCVSQRQTQAKTAGSRPPGRLSTV